MSELKFRVIGIHARNKTCKMQRQNQYQREPSGHERTGTFDAILEMLSLGNPRAMVEAIALKATETTSENTLEMISANTLEMTSPNTLESTFHLFPKLPIELRLKIWSFVVTTPGIIRQERHCGRFMMLKNQRFSFRRSIPAVLHACNESRMHFMELEDKNDLTHVGHPRYKLSMFNRYDPFILFSPQVDSVYATLEVVLTLGIRRELRHLITNSRQFTPNQTFEGHNANALVQLSGLATLTLLVEASPFHEPEELPDEVYGQVNWKVLSPRLRHYFLSERSRVTRILVKIWRENSNWKLPALKIRAMSQFKESLKN